MILLQHLDEARLAELIARHVLRFGDAVAIQHHRIAGFEVDRVARVRRDLKQADRHAARFNAAQAAGAEHQRRIVAGVAEHQLAVAGQLSVQQRRVPRVDGSARQHLVDMVNGLFRAVADRHERGENAENLRRQQCRRRPFAGYVADEETKLAVGHVLHVEKVAADGAGLHRHAG